jgi:hypothetical protein
MPERLVTDIGGLKRGRSPGGAAAAVLATPANGRVQSALAREAHPQPRRIPSQDGRVQPARLRPARALCAGSKASLLCWRRRACCTLPRWRPAPGRCCGKGAMVARAEPALRGRRPRADSQPASRGTCARRATCAAASARSNATAACSKIRRSASGREGRERIPLYRVHFEQRELWSGYAGDAHDTLEIEIYQHWLAPEETP